MQCTQGSTASNDPGFFASIIFYIRHNLPHDILIELLVTNGFVPWMHFTVQPALRVDAIDGKDFYFAGFNKWFNHIEHKKPLVFEIISSSCRDQEKRKSEMTIDGNFHLLIQRWAEPRIYNPLHIELVFERPKILKYFLVFSC